MRNQKKAGQPAFFFVWHCDRSTVACRTIFGAFLTMNLSLVNVWCQPVPRRQRGVSALAAASFVVLVSAMPMAYAAQPLAHGTVPGVGPVQVSADDVAADILRIPAEVRPQVLTQTKTMNQLVTNLYTRRALAERAHVEGLDKRADVAAALALARDKVLSDALLAFVVVYFAVFGMGIWYLLQLMKKPPEAHEPPPSDAPIRSAGITPAPAIIEGASS